MYLNSVFPIVWIVEHGYNNSKVIDLIPGNTCNRNLSPYACQINYKQ